MGPLQYMVLGYQRNHFRDNVLVELRSLSRRGVICVLDALFVKRDSRGKVTSQELAEAMPDEDKLISNPSTDEWFTQDNVDAIGECLPNGTAVALLLFEHLWANRLEDAVQQGNTFLGEQETSSLLALELEHILATGSGARML